MKLQNIDRFGLEAITGRRLFYFGELQRLITAENVVTAYKSRQQAANWVTWSKEHPSLARLLNEAERLSSAE